MGRLVLWAIFIALFERWAYFFGSVYPIDV